MIIKIQQHNKLVWMHSWRWDETEITDRIIQFIEPKLKRLIKNSVMENGYYDLILLDNNGKEIDRDILII